MAGYFADGDAPSEIQPQGPVALSESNPDARGIIGSWLPFGRGYFDASPYRNHILTPTGGDVPLDAKGRRAIGRNFTTSQYFIGGNSTPAFVSAFSIAAWLRFDESAVSYGVMLGRGQDTATDWLFGFVGGGTKQMLYSRNGAEFLASSTLKNDTEYHRWVLTVDAAGLGTWYCDGLFSNSASGKVVRTAASNLYVNAREYGTLSSANAAIGQFTFWNRAITAAQVRRDFEDSNAIYEQLSSLIWVPVSGAASYTLTADAATYALTGQAAGLRADRKLTAAAGSYALTGNAAGVLHSRRLVAQAATYAWTASDATLRSSRVLAAAAASYTLTGNAAGLRAARLLSAAAASYTWTGNDATLNYAPLGSYSLAADAGSYTLTGNAAGLRADRRLVAGTGIYNLTGSAASLLRGYRLAADVQTYALTGQAATLSKTSVYSLAAAAAAYTWTGSAASLLYSGAPIAVRYANRSRTFFTGRELRSITTQRITRSITP